jgi:hypothetical protein
LESNGTVYHLFIDFKKAYNSVSRELLYNILIEFYVHIKLRSLGRYSSLADYGHGVKLSYTLNYVMAVY